MSIILIFCYDVFIQCHYFDAKNIKIKGNHIISEKEILKTTGIRENVNILSLNLMIARKKLMANPWVAEAKISRELPSDLNIEIKEHVPMAVIDMGNKYLMDIDGNIFKAYAESDPKNLPTVSGLNYADISVNGKGGSIPFNSCLEILQIGQDINNVISNKTVQEINVDSDMGITLYAFDPVKTIFLGYNSYMAKYDQLKSIMNFLKENFSKVNLIDLQNLHRIVASPNPFEISAKSNKEVKSAGT